MKLCEVWLGVYFLPGHAKFVQDCAIMSVLQARPRALNRFSDGSYVFDFTFRKDALCQVTGLLVGHSDGDRCLTIVVVDPRGPVAAWNSACEAAGRSEIVREGTKSCR